jgi:putative tryptophan/tyrosine transport system substrate-binding protein
MMDRRAFIVGGVAAVAAPLAAEAQQAGKVYRIWLIGLDAAEVPGHTAFRQGLRDLGYEEGKNVAIEYRGAEGQYDRLPTLTAELVNLPVDVLVTNGTPGARAAKQATTKIPIVVAIGDAVAAGIVSSLARPGGNITGSQFYFPDTMAKRIELLREAIPRLGRIAILFNGANQSIGPALDIMEATARRFNVELQQIEVRGPQDFDAAFGAMHQRRSEALIVADDSMLRTYGHIIADLSAKTRLPSAGDREYVRDGGFLAYAVNRPEVWRRAAILVDKVLKGARPSDVPFERTDRIELVINLKTARALGLTIPPSLLLRADQVIE